MKRPYANHKFPVYLLFWLGTAVTLTACFGGGGAEEQSVATGQTVLICNEVCAQQGQCGKATDGRPLILGRSDRPETRDHNLVFNADLPVTIVETRVETIQAAEGQFSMQQFSLVILNDNGQQGWVADWCVASAP
ncbi:MAG TPA: hypothetical protein PLD25_02650 [Chloroflexota bacterium]|nr:hypothetical protein [Chloroflexota bacterium]